MRLPPGPGRRNRRWRLATRLAGGSCRAARARAARPGGWCNPTARSRPANKRAREPSLLRRHRARPIAAASRSRPDCEPAQPAPRVAAIRHRAVAPYRLATGEAAGSRGKGRRGVIRGSPPAPTRSSRSGAERLAGARVEAIRVRRRPAVSACAVTFRFAPVVGHAAWWSLRRRSPQPPTAGLLFLIVPPAGPAGGACPMTSGFGTSSALSVTDRSAVTRRSKSLPHQAHKVQSRPTSRSQLGQTRFSRVRHHGQMIQSSFTRRSQPRQVLTASTLPRSASSARFRS